MNNQYIACATLTAVIVMICATTIVQAKQKIKVGDKGPDFILKDESGNEHSLSAMLGKKIALVFYPKNETAGCTKEACSIRDGYTDLQNAGIEILGISSSSIESNLKFKEKYHLPFPILSDSKKKIASVYGAYRWFWFNKRMTVLINEQGLIVQILYKVQLSSHAQQIIDAFK